MMEDEELKPCPFCGSKAYFNEWTAHGNYCCAVCCSDRACRASAIHTLHNWRSKESAVRDWNRRKVQLDDKEYVTIDNPCFHCYTGAIGECAMTKCRHQFKSWSKDLERMTLDLQRCEV